MKKLAAAAVAIAPLFLLTGCSKPEKAEVNTAVVKFLEDAGMPEEGRQALADCVTDEIYDDMSRSGLNSLIEDSVDGRVTSDDYDTMEEALGTCAGQVN